MAKKDLHNFLTKLDAELEKSAQVYRKATANKKETVFVYKESTIRKVLAIMLSYSAANKATSSRALSDKEWKAGDAMLEKEEIKGDFEEALTKLTTSVNATFKAAAAESQVKSESWWNMKVTIDEVETRVVLLENANNSDKFRKVQKSYRKTLKTFYEAFLKIIDVTKNPDLIKRPSSKKDEVYTSDTAGKVFHLEHTKDSSNVEHFIQDAVVNALNEVYVAADAEGPAVIDEETAALLKEYDLEDILTIQKNVKLGTIHLILGSQILNSIESANESKIKVDLQNKIKAAIEKLGGVGELEGSDSLVTGVRKNAIKAIMKQFSTIKGAKITIEPTKIKESKAPVGLKKSLKVTKTARRAAIFKRSKPKKAKQKRQAASPSTPNLASIIGILQQKLPQTVEKNMGSPRLNNRTGRFAGSVQVTDIAQTAKGFPSIGYTYMKRPYQTFETSGAQGSVDRDPRTLIDGSIREIAAGLAMGRFYTRRV